MLELGLMKFTLKIGRLEEAEVEALLVLAWEEEWPAQTEALNRELSGLLKKEVLKRDFEAKSGKILLLSTLGKIPAKTLLLVGLGKKEELNPLKLRQIFAKLERRLKEEGIKTLALSANFEVDLISALVEGILLGSYQFLKYKSDEVKKPTREEMEVVFFS